jgi:hypothetical protein
VYTFGKTIVDNKVKDRMSSAYKIASSTTKKVQEHQKDGYDLKTRGGIVEVGDTVLVKIVAWDGKHKLSEHWEDQPRQSYMRLTFYLLIL